MRREPFVPNGRVVGAAHVRPAAEWQTSICGKAAGRACRPLQSYRGDSLCFLTAELDRLSATDWQPFFAQERAKPYFAELDAFCDGGCGGKNRLPPRRRTSFAAFRACPVSAVRVVILGQDPYHEQGQAMGLSFSVPDGCKAPPSLRNIFKELEAERWPRMCRTHPT